MTLLTSLLLFALWAIVLVFLIAFHRWKLALTGKVPKGGFPSDVPPEDGFYRRVMQAHRNATENLAIYGALVAVVSFMGLTDPMLGTLGMVVILGRVAQSLIHVSLVQTRPIVMTRFFCYLAQVLSFLWIGWIAWQG